MVPFLLLVLLAWTALAGMSPPAAPDPAFSPAAAETSAVARRVGPSPATVELRNDLEQTIRVPGWRADFSVTVVSVDRGDTLFTHNPDLPLAPASNMKLYTTTAALYYLGPNYRYSTYLLSGGDLRDGVLGGDLVLYGTGDPSLSFRFHGNSYASMQAFADSIAALGVKEIRGDIVGDGSYFQGYAAGYDWDPNYMNTSYAVPSSALSLNENLVTLRITPGPQVGTPAVIQGQPGGTWLNVQNETTTTAGGGTAIDARRWQYGGPVVVRGRIRRGAGVITRVVVAADPAQYAAAALREALEDKGIKVDGRARAVYDSAQSPVTGRAVFAPAFGRGQPLHVLTVYQSPALLEILDILMHLSHNMFAEQTLRTVGRVALGSGSAPGGHRAVMDMLGCETGRDTSSLLLHQIDGSGLSPEDRTTTRSMVQLLTVAARLPLFPSLWLTLPEAGHAHLRRMIGTAAQNNLRAKTGTIDNVSALSGYVRAADGERLAFSIISNGDPSTWKAKRVEDAIGSRLAAFSRPEGELATPPAPDFRSPVSAAPAPAVVAAPAAGLPVATAPAAAAPATPAPELSAVPFWHTVERGETVGGIARRYGVTLAALGQANPGLSPRRIRPGQHLRLPSGARPPSVRAASPAPRATTTVHHRTPKRHPRRHHR
jgi:D-alanyl-D-alanine carboxypeptidase/D-alanyl-D-alanine-endopeptidase (penicillin-binding protein 4)